MRRPGDEWPALLAAAAVARLPALLEAASDPRPWEDRLLALSAPRRGVRALPWQVVLGLEDALDAIARRRGDAALLAELPARTGCLTAATLVGSVGRLPTWICWRRCRRRSGRARPPTAVRWRSGAAGCWCRRARACPGVRVLQASLPAGRARPPAGDRLRRSGAGAGGWRRLASRTPPGIASGPGSMLVADGLGAKAQPIDVRLGTWGGATSLRLFALQPRAALSLQPSADRDPARAALRTHGPGAGGRRHRRGGSGAGDGGPAARRSDGSPSGWRWPRR